MMRVKNHQTPPTIRPERDLWKNTDHQISSDTSLDLFICFWCRTEIHMHNPVVPILQASVKRQLAPEAFLGRANRQVPALTQLHTPHPAIENKDKETGSSEPTPSGELGRSKPP